MHRDNRLVVMLRPDERRAIERLAGAERLPSSTLVRKLLLEEAERRGLLDAGSQDGDQGAMPPQGAQSLTRW